MDGLIFFLLLIVVLLLIIGMPILLSIWVFKIMKKRCIDPKWRVLAFIPVFLLLYFIYFAFFPSEEFYETDFKEVTGIELPESADFEFKTASYPDHFGDYTSVSIINIEAGFYQSLERKLIDQGFSRNKGKVHSSELENATSKLQGLKIEKEYSKENGGKNYYVAFLSDGETILVQRLSW